MISKLYEFYSQRSMSVKIMMWMLLGIAAGVVWGEDAMIVKPVGDLFIRLLVMAAVPLVFFNLIAAITNLADLRVLGRLGSMTFIYYLITTAFALSLGLLMASLFRPGADAQIVTPVEDNIGTVPSISDIVLDLFPGNILEAFITGNVSQVAVIALLLGVTILLLPTSEKEKFQNAFALIAQLMRQLVNLVLLLAPFGVGALAAATVGEYGNTIIAPLSKFLSVVWGTQIAMMGAYMLLLYCLTKRKPLPWLQTSAPLYATTIATASSVASLAVAMEVAERRLRLSRNVYSFTLPLGIQLNKDGTAITLACIIMFTAQATGHSFSMTELMSVLFVGLLLAESGGGVPGGGMVVAFVFVKAFGLPLEVAAIVAGVYRLIDMGATTVNVMGDMLWSTILSDREQRRQQSGY